MKISKKWSMPSAQTYQIKPISELISKYIPQKGMTVDPFAGDSTICQLTNDIDPGKSAKSNDDALVFLSAIKDSSVDFVLFDPPYSPRQVSECYKKLDKTVDSKTTSARFWRLLKIEISRIVKKGGRVISFGWNSQGVGKKYGFSPIEILLVAHGGNHNDTICVVEEKIK